MIGINGLSNIARMPRISRPANKKKSGTAALHRMLLTILLCLVGWGEAWAYGETTSYVYQNAGEKSASDWGNIIWTDANSALVSFQATKSMASAVGDLRVDAYINGSWTEILRIKVGELEKNKYKPFSIDVTGRNVSGLRFKNEGSYTRKIMDIRVKRATNITATTTSIDFGTRTINDASITKTASFSFNNTTYNQQVTGSCTDSHFTVSPVVVGATGSYSVNVTYSSTTPGDHSGTVTLSMNGATTTFTVSGSTTATYNFSATANPNNTAFGTVSASVANTSVTSTNTSEETTATFTATANSGYEFAGWGTTQDATSYESTANPYQPTITNSKPGSTANKTLYAIFKPVFKFTATAEKINGNYGQVTSTVTPKILGEPSETTKTTQATFTATPNENCTFHGWYYDAAHTQKASDEATYTPDITNNKIGSTENLTLYAWFKSNQTLTFTSASYDKNIVLGSTVTGALTATASSGLTNFTYTSSNSYVVSVNNNGDVKAESLANDDVTITVTQPGNDEYNPASITREFHVISKIETTFTPSGFTGTSPTIHVGDQPTIEVKDEGDDFTFTFDSSNPEVVSISKIGTTITLKALKVGSSTVTLTQRETDTHSAVKQTYFITVAKVANTLQLTLPTQSAQVDGTIQVNMMNQNNAKTQIEARITKQVLSSKVYNSENVITYENGTIKACNAGTAQITFTQDATDTYEGFTSSTFDITVTKIPNPIAITLNGGSATAIKLKYGETASLNYSSAHRDADINVTQTSGSYTTLSGNTITAGNAAGTDLYAVTQAETYKYEKGYATFSVRVNNTSEEEMYIINDENEHAEWTLTTLQSYSFDGHPGDVVKFEAKRARGGSNDGFYLEYSTDNGATWHEKWYFISTTSDWQTYTVPLPEDVAVTNIRFELHTNSTLNKYISNVKVTRKTYLKATVDKTDMGTIYTGNTAQATFTVNYSTTNGDNIKLNSNNSHFVTSATELATTQNSDGTKTFTVTYTPSPKALGAESAVITVGDLFYSQQFTLTATADKRANTLSVIPSQKLMVDDVVTPVYADKNSEATLSTSLSKEGVITFDASTNTVTAVGAGEATLTLTQVANDTHHETTQRVTFTVSKHDQTLFWDKEPSKEQFTLKIGDELSTKATATSGLAVTYSSSNDKVLQVDPNTGEIEALAVGADIVVTATQSGNDKYNAASITRHFTVISKMNATVTTILSDTEDNLLTLGEDPVTIGCIAPITAANFTIAGNEDDIITTSFANNTLTITPLKAGTVMITFSRAEDDGYNALSQSYTIEVVNAVLTLNPATAPAINFTEYSQITLQRTLKAGHSTLTLPFDTKISDLAGDDSNAYVAQLALATYNQADGYTLYFRKVEDGIIQANQPYLLYLPQEVSNRIFTHVTASKPEEIAITQNGWTMHGNYTPAKSMSGRYGMAGGKLCLGGSNATLNAYTAYFEAPATTQHVRVRVAVEDGNGNTTWLGEMNDEEETVEAVYGLDGMKLGTMRHGVNIVRQKDGTVKKIWKK